MRSFLTALVSLPRNASCVLRSAFFVFHFSFYVSAFLIATPLFAQDPPDPISTARFRFGPLAFTPGLTISNVGVDTNVFNQWDAPRQDFTATFAPQADFWLRAGKARISAKASVAYVYFGRYVNERAFNTNLSARVELPLAHVRPYVFGSSLNVRERPGYEIDVRARRFEDAFGAGVNVAISWPLTLGVQARRTRTAYAADAEFLGTRLRDVYDRTTDTIEISFRYRATPLTTLVVRAEVERQRFTYSPSRDADGLRVMPGIEFDAFAIVQGSAYVGFRRLDLKAAGMPDYSGPVAAVTLGHTVLGMTRIDVRAERDVNYSFQAHQPFYVLTGATLTITQRLRGPWDVQARGGLQRLAYRDATGPALSGAAVAPGRVDNVTFYGGGLGYKVNNRMRLGMNLDSVRRQSVTAQRTYNGLRAGSSVTYGF